MKLEGEGTLLRIYLGDGLVTLEKVRIICHTGGHPNA